MTISPEYKAQLQATHSADRAWGTTASRWAGHVQALVDEHRYKTVLDYGAGKGVLRGVLARCDVREYDPGIPGKDGPPEPADLVVALDVLEHIEPEYLDDVLRHIDGLAGGGLFFNVALYPAGTWLPDGRNAHLIVERPTWWEGRIRSAFPEWELDFVHQSRVSRNGKNKDCLIVRGRMQV